MGQPILLPNVPYRDFSTGMVNEVANALLPVSAARLVANFHLDVIGKLIQRNGTTRLGNDVSPGDTILGLFNFVNSAGTVRQVIAGAGSSVFNFSDPNWIAVRGGLTPNRKQRFTQFVDLVFMVNGAESLATWNGVAGAFGATNTAGAPVARYIESFKNRVFLGSLSGAEDRIQYSSINNGDTITWPSTNFIDVNRKDGENITGLKRNGNLLIIFKENSLYRWDGRSVDADLVTDVGTTSQESVANAKGFTFFFNPRGIYLTQGGFPVEISRPVDRWIRGMSAGFYDDVAGWTDRDHYYCHIGTTTVDGTTFTNAGLVYTISKKSWHAYTFADDFRVFTVRRAVDGTLTILGGDTNGAVQTMLSGNTDNGDPIVYEFESKEFEYDSRGSLKTITDAAAYSTVAGPTSFGVRADGRSDVHPFGQLSGPVSRFRGVDISGRFFSFKLWGSNTGTPVELDGFEVIAANSQGFID